MPQPALANLKRWLPIRRTDTGLVWENLGRSALVLTMVLVPVLVLPLTGDAWEIHKAAALILLTSLAWICTWVAAWRRGQQTWVWLRSDSLVLALALVTLLGTWLSVDPWIGLAGVSGAWSETAPVLLALISWWWLWPQLFREPGSRLLLWIGLAIGLVGALLFQIFQFAGVPLLPGLSRQPLFSIISQAPLDSAMLAAVVGTAALMWWSRTREAWQRWLLAAGLTISWLVLFFLQQPVAWGAFALGMIAVVVLESRQGRQARTGLVIGAVMLAGLGILAQATNLPAQSSVPRMVDVRLDAASSWAITRTTLAHRPALGTGPNTWYQAFVRYRSTDFNASPWWSIRFVKAHNAWAQIIATGGLAGGLIWLMVLGWMSWRAWQGWRQGGHPGFLLAGLILVLTLFGGLLTTWSLVWGLLVWSTLGWLRLQSQPGSLRSQPIGPVMLAGAAVVTLGLVWFWYAAGRVYASAVLVARAQTAIVRTAPLDQIQARLRSALDLNPRNLAAAELLGHAYATQAELAAQAGQTDQAIAAVRTALTAVQPSLTLRAVDPTATEVMNNLLNRLSPFIADAEETARQNFAALRRLEPASPIHDVGYGQTLLVSRTRLLSSQTVTDQTREQAKQLLTQAQAAFASALRKKPDYLPARLAQAQALNLAGQPAAALAELDQVADVGAPFGLYWRERGIAESKLGQAEEAKTAFEKALEVDPQDVTSYLAYSQHFKDAKRTDQARQVLERGLAVMPDLPVLKQALDELSS